MQYIYDASFYVNFKFFFSFLSYFFIISFFSQNVATLFHLLLDLGVYSPIILHLECLLSTQHWLCKYFIIEIGSFEVKQDFFSYHISSACGNPIDFSQQKSTASFKLIILFQMSILHLNFTLLGVLYFFSLSNSVFYVVEKMNEHQLNTNN